MKTEKASLFKRFKENYALRGHMSLILLITALSGVAASRLLLLLQCNNIAVRYPVAVIMAYLVFLLCIKLWLVILRPTTSSSSSLTSDSVGNIDLPGIGMNFNVDPAFAGHGGDFSGAGASASFDAVTSEPSGMASCLGDAFSETAGEAVGAAGDEGGAVVVIAFGLLALVAVAVLGSAFYLVCEAPAILYEAAFDGFLAASLIRKTKALQQRNWLGGILRNTWAPFAVTLGFTIAASLLLHNLLPNLVRVSELWH